MKLNSKEAVIFGNYIIGTAINQTAINRYYKAISKLNITEEDKLSQKIVNHPWLLPYIDSALSIKNKNHNLKKKLLVMFAIVETMPEYSSCFLAQPRKKIYIFSIIYVGLVAVIKAIFGLVILRFIKT